MKPNPSFSAVVETISGHPAKPSLAARVRKFWDELTYSQYTRFLEREICNLRLEHSCHVEVLQAEKLTLSAKIERLEAALLPRAATAGPNQTRAAQPTKLPLTSWEQVVAQQVKENAELDTSDKGKQS